MELTLKEFEVSYCIKRAMREIEDGYIENGQGYLRVALRALHSDESQTVEAQ